MTLAETCIAWMLDQEVEGAAALPCISFDRVSLAGTFVGAILEQEVEAAFGVCDLGYSDDRCWSESVLPRGTASNSINVDGPTGAGELVMEGSKLVATAGFWAKVWAIVMQMFSRARVD
jgi:hypothetical protein